MKALTRDEALEKLRNTNTAYNKVSNQENCTSTKSDVEE